MLIVRARNLIQNDVTGGIQNQLRKVLDAISDGTIRNSTLRNFITRNQISEVFQLTYSFISPDEIVPWRGQTLLGFACGKGKPSLVSTIIACGGVHLVNTPDLYSVMPLGRAVLRNDPLSVDVAAILIRFGAKINVKIQDYPKSGSLFRTAFQKGNYLLGRLLAAHGAEEISKVVCLKSRKINHSIFSKIPKELLDYISAIYLQLFTN